MEESVATLREQIVGLGENLESAKLTTRTVAILKLCDERRVGNWM